MQSTDQEHFFFVVCIDKSEFSIGAGQEKASGGKSAGWQQLLYQDHRKHLENSENYACKNFTYIPKKADFHAIKMAQNRFFFKKRNQ